MAGEGKGALDTVAPVVWLGASRHRVRTSQELPVGVDDKSITRAVGREMHPAGMPQNLRARGGVVCY